MVDLFKLQPSTEHPHGLTDQDFDSLFTVDKPMIFNFHGYPWLIHRLAYRRTNHSNIHVRGYKEKGNINTPMELAINNEIDRFSLAIDAIDRTRSSNGSARTPRKITATSRPIAVTTHTSTVSTSRRSSRGDGRIRNGSTPRVKGEFVGFGPYGQPVDRGAPRVNAKRARMIMVQQPKPGREKG